MKSSRKWSVIMFGALFLTSCHHAPDKDHFFDDTSSAMVIETTGPLPSDADLSTPPRASVQFAGDWRILSFDTIYHGAELMVTVDPARFPVCGTWGEITIFIRSENGDIQEYSLAEGYPGGYRWGSAELPASGASAEMWLRAMNKDGCLEWDSDYGRNYLFHLRKWNPVRIRFNADRTERAESLLTENSVLVLDYDWERLPWCRIIYRGFPGWNIIAHGRFDTGERFAQSIVGRPSPSEIEHRLAVVEIPGGARRVEIWFENKQYPPTCHAWDSDYGNNYHFSIEPAH